MLMTVPVVETVTPEVKTVQPEVVEQVDHHTPETPAPPPAHQDNGIEELKKTVGQLATAVTSLTELVTKSHQDESPNKVPWTHRGGPVHDND